MDYLNFLGTVVFSISGVLLAGKVRMDLFGVLVLGIVTAIGGGTIRDVILSAKPVFWVTEPIYLIIAMVTSLVSVGIIKPSWSMSIWILPTLDAIGLSTFVAVGINRAFDCDNTAFIAVCMGVVTGVGGGIIRDILAREVPIILCDELYATACIIGGGVHVILYKVCHMSLMSSSLIGMMIIFCIRLAAIRWHLRLPKFELKGGDS